MELRLITHPTIEPVTRADAQEHLRAPAGGPDASLIAGYIQAARETVESETGRALLPQTWELRLPEFPAFAIEIPRAPLISVVSVRYTSPAGADVLLAAEAYQVEAPSGATAGLAKVWPAPGDAWPATRSGDRAAVRVRFTAGYATPAAVPAALRSAVLLLLGDLYANREAGAEKALAVNPAVARLLAPHRVWWL